MDGLLQVLVGVDLDRDFRINRQIGTLIYPKVLRLNQIVLPSGKPRCSGDRWSVSAQRDRHED
jgi:hypothetical protein